MVWPPQLSDWPVRVLLATAVAFAWVSAEGGYGALWLTTEFWLVPQPLYGLVGAAVLIAALRRVSPGGVPSTVVGTYAVGGAIAVLLSIANFATLYGDQSQSRMLYAELVAAGVILVSARSAFFRQLVVDVGILFAVHLVLTGAALWRPGRLPFAVSLHLVDRHALVGSLSVAALLAFIYVHLRTWEQRAAPLGRWLGFLAILGAFAVTLTGQNRVAAAVANGVTALVVHLAAAVAAIVLVALHAFHARHRLPAAGTTASSANRFRVSALVLVGVAWASLSVFEDRSDVAPSRVEVPDVVAAPASDPAPFASHDLDPSARRPGCSSTNSCHGPELDQWRRSGHAGASNPVFRAVVTDLVAERGPDAARTCAACHDPVPLLTGAGTAPPHPAGPGVTCLVCHLTRVPETAGPAPGDGRYTIERTPLFARQLATPAVMAFEVYEHMPEHRAVISSPSLRDDRLCAACHQLKVGDVVLRRTSEEFAEGRPGRTCRSCHMPEGIDPLGERRPRDHRFLGANFALPGLDATEREARRRFVADALELSAGFAESPDTLRFTIRNTGVGHGFPTGPLDLVRWTVEVRDAAAPDTAFTRIGPASLFEEDLLDSEGRPLRRHEIWKVHALHDASGRVPERGMREFDLPLPPALAKASLVARLVTRRLDGPLAEEARRLGAFVEPVEIWRGPVAPRP